LRPRCLARAGEATGAEEEEEQLGEDRDALALRPRSRLGFCGAEEQLADIIFFLPEKSRGIPSLAAWRACGGARGAAAWMREKPAIPHRILVIEFGLDVLLALDFNRDEFLCIFFWAHNGWRLSAGDVFLGEPSIILIGPL